MKCGKGVSGKGRGEGEWRRKLHIVHGPNLKGSHCINKDLLLLLLFLNGLIKKKKRKAWTMTDGERNR